MGKRKRKTAAVESDVDTGAAAGELATGGSELQVSTVAAITHAEVHDDNDGDESDGCEVPDDNDADEIEYDDEGAEEGDGHRGVEEEDCGDLAVVFGDDARFDDGDSDGDSGDDVWDDEKVPDPLSSSDEDEEQSRPRRAYRVNVNPEDLLGLGQTFSSAEEFKHALLRYTLKSRYDIKLYRSSALKLGAKCSNRDPKVTCPWRVYCSYEKRKQKLMIKCYVSEHKCLPSGYSKYLKRSTVAMLYSERLRLNPKITKEEMAGEIQREYKMVVSKDTCAKAKTKIMKERKASHEEHFGRVWDYQAEILRSNPGSTMDIETIPGPSIGSKQRFYRLYVCFESQKSSWKSTCRPIIGLDGAFLKWDIKGHLLGAVGRDGDNMIVPLAWAIVEIENDTNWDWFVRHITRDLGLNDGKGYAILSDKQKGLVKAVHTILPQAEHRQCCRHIYDNWKKDSHDMRLQRLFWKIARSYTNGDFSFYMAELEKYNAGAYSTLQVTKPETWSRAFFGIGTLCNDNLNNLCESFNRTIRGARKKPLLELLEDIRRQCMVRNAKRQILAKRLKTRFTKRAMSQIGRVEYLSKECIIFLAVGTETEIEHKGVSYSVDIPARTCGCRRWQMTGIPCIHAAAAITGKKLHITDFVAPCYAKETWCQTYSVGIRPVQGMKLWPVTNRLGVLPPPWRNGNPGRPKNHDRFKSQYETASSSDPNKLSRALRIITCSNCKQDGHNRKTCKNDTVASEPKRPRGRPRKNQESQGETSQASQPQASSRWDQASQPQASQASQASQATQASQVGGWGRWFL